jgi:hypothetical protein
MIEMINGRTQDYESEELQSIAQLIRSVPVMETWQVENILAAV